MNVVNLSLNKWFMNSLAIIAVASALTVASVSEASVTSPSIKLRKISRITAPEEATTQAVIKTLKAKIESDCLSLSKTSSDTVEILSEKIVGSSLYGGRNVPVGKPGCDDQDLPCSAVPTARVGASVLRELSLVLVRKQGGQRYYIRASAGWDLDLPQPRAEIHLDSKHCN